jgi:hypothetical protein
VSLLRRLVPHLLALALGVAAAVAVGCGGSDANLIPSDDASRLKDRIAEVRDAIEAGDCARAEAAVERAIGSARLVDPDVDRRLRMRINQGLRALRDRVPTACRETQTETVTVPTTTEPTTTETTPTTTPTTTTPPETTPTTTTPTTPTETTPPATTPSDSGGTGAPQP